ncbi:hypothetical protein GCM10009616_18360 [Microlunatus lacustris]
MAIALPTLTTIRPRRRTARRLPDPATAASWPAATTELVLREARAGRVNSAYLLAASAAVAGSVGR